MKFKQLLSKREKRNMVFNVRLHDNEIDRFVEVFGNEKNKRASAIKLCINIALTQLQFVDENPKAFAKLSKLYGLNTVDELPELLLLALKANIGD